MRASEFITEAIEDNVTGYRGVSREELEEILKTKHALPSSDLMPFDNEIIEYSIGEESFQDMSPEEVEQWVRDTVPWYNGSLQSVQGGVNYTTDLDNAEGYGEYILALQVRGDHVDFSDVHGFAKNYKDVSVVAYKKRGRNKWITIKPKQGVAEGVMSDLDQDRQDVNFESIVGYVINGLKKNMDIGRMELNLYQWGSKQLVDVDQELQDRGFRNLADLVDHIEQHNGKYVPPTDFGLGNLDKGVAEGRENELELEVRHWQQQVKKLQNDPRALKNAEKSLAKAQERLAQSKKGVSKQQLDEKCWDTHRQEGMKKKGNRMVPNCVPKESIEEATICSECGGPSYSNPMLAEKKDACYHKVKSRVKVWPSAYASGQLVQCRRRGAKNWGTGGKKK